MNVVRGFKTKNSQVMKRQLLFLLMISISATTLAQNVGIGNTTFTPNASSLLELRSTSAGFLMPRMTESQRDAIVNPATGLMIYQTNNTSGYYYYTGSAWEAFGAAASIDNMGDHTATENLVVGVGLGVTDTDEDTKIQLEQNTDEDKIRFRVAGTEAMVIDNSSNVGIGTELPSRNLQIQVNNNGTNFPLFIRNENGTTGGNGVGIGFNSEQNGDWIKAGIFHERTGGYGVGKLHFLVDNATDDGSVSLAQSRMTITHQGAVGVGTQNPSAQLHTTGTVKHEDLSGSDTRMVVADEDGNLSTQNITTAVSGALDEITRAVSASSNQNTNSGSNSDLNSMSMSVEPGRYIFQFNCDMQVTNGNTVGEFSFNVNGSTITESIRKIKPGTNSPGIATLITVVNVTSSGTVKVQFRRNAGSGTVKVGGRTLMVMKISV